MPIVNYGQDPDRQMRRMLMMQEFMNKSPLVGGESELDRVLKEQAEEAKEKRKEAREERESAKRLENIESDITTRQGRLDLETWGKGREDVRQERDLESTISTRAAQADASRASAGHARALTGQSQAATRETEVDIKGKEDERKRKINEASLNEAERKVQMAIRSAVMGEVVPKSQADKLEDSYRLLNGDPAYTLPRNPDGSWKPPEDVAYGMLDKNGQPTLAFAEKLRKIEAPYSDYGKLVKDATIARDSGASPEVMAWWGDKFLKETALNKNQLEYGFVKPFLDVGDVEGANKVLTGLRNQPKDFKLPSKEERVEFARQTRMVNDMDNIARRFQELKDNGKIPVGALKQPFHRILATIGNDDPEVQALIKEIERMKGEYLLYLSGRAATDAERDDIKTRIPTIFDSPQTFEMALPRFRDKVAGDMSIDAGVLQMFGLKTPDNIPIVDPWDVISRDGKLPSIVLENGYIPSDRAMGMAEGYRRTGQNMKQVAGPNELRPKPIETPYDQLGESTEAAPPGQVPSQGPAYPTDPKAYANPPKVRGLMKEADKLRQELGR